MWAATARRWPSPCRCPSAPRSGVSSRASAVLPPSSARRPASPARCWCKPSAPCPRTVLLACPPTVQRLRRPSADVSAPIILSVILAWRAGPAPRPVVPNAHISSGSTERGARGGVPRLCGRGLPRRREPTVNWTNAARNGRVGDGAGVVHYRR